MADLAFQAATSLAFTLRALLSCVYVVLVLLGTLAFLRCFWTFANSSRNDSGQTPRRKRPTKSMPPVYPNGWIPVLESCELGPGQVKPLDVMGEQLVAFRTADSKVGVADAYCPHLGAHLGVRGRVVGNCIECPFHGWRFDATDGLCRHVPYSDSVPRFVRLKIWRSKELLGLIFIWYHADGEEPSWDVPDVPEITSGHWLPRGRTCHLVHCHIQDIAENGADLGHFNYVHAPSAALSGENYAHYAKSTWWGKFSQHRWQATWTPKRYDAVMEIRSQVSFLGLWPKLLTLDGVVQQIGPALVYIRLKSKFGSGVFIQSLTPVGPLEVKVVHRLFADARMSRIFSWALLRGTREMFERDVAIWNHKVYHKYPALVKEDRTIATYRRWYSQFYSKSSPTIADVRERTLEW